MYDRNGRVATHNMKLDIDYPETEWFDMRTETYDEEIGLWIYPILSVGKVMGFIVCYDKDDGVRLATTYLGYAIQYHH